MPDNEKKSSDSSNWAMVAVMFILCATIVAMTWIVTR